MAVDVLLQAEQFTHELATSTAATLDLRIAGPTTPAPITQRTLTTSGTWAQRYDDAGIQIPDPGVSQGLIGDDGHERSLVGFNITELPADADVSVVRLRVDWTRWAYANGVGSLVLGWHDHDTAPLDWSVGGGAAQLVAYDARQQLDVVLDWAGSAIESGSFRGLAIGPGDNDAPLYAGSSDVAAHQWALEIRYTTREVQP